MFRVTTSLIYALLATVVASAVGYAADIEYTLTGTGVRIKKVAFVSVKTYQISHSMFQPPAHGTPLAVINADTGKRFVLRMLRDMDHEKLAAGLREGFALNGYTNSENISKFLAALSKDLPEGSTVAIA